MQTGAALRSRILTWSPGTNRKSPTGANCRPTPLSSDRLGTTQDRLKNWGRYSRDENPHIWYPTSASGFADFIPDGAEEGSVDSDGAVEDRWIAPDRKDAEFIDVQIMHLAARH